MLTRYFSILDYFSAILPPKIPVALTNLRMACEVAIVVVVYALLFAVKNQIQ